MKKTKIVLIAFTAIAFMTGALLFSYPSISDYFNKKNNSRVIDSYTSEVQDIDNEVIEKQFAEAHKYNEQLYKNMVVITDPFDNDSLTITDEKYENVLNLCDIMAYIEIPAINVYLPIYHGTSEKTLEKGVGHLENTSLPVGGASTHTVLSAHCGLPSAMFFTDLEKLQVGNIFKIYVLDETLYYKIVKTEVVLPTECSALYIKDGEDMATLMTCTPYGENTHRLLVHGIRIQQEEAETLEQTEPEIEKKMTAEDLLNIVMAVLSAFFFVLLVLIFIKFRRKDSENEQK